MRRFASSDLSPVSLLSSNASSSLLADYRVLVISEIPSFTTLSIASISIVIDAFTVDSMPN